MNEAPREWQTLIEGHTWHEVSEGGSLATVYRLTRPNSSDLYVKKEVVHHFAETPGEAARLKWLRGSDVSCPRVVSALQEESHFWLLLNAVPGKSLAHASAMEAEPVVQIVADALGRLHDLPLDDCPFDMRLATRIPLAIDRVSAGLVDESDFDEERNGRSARDLLEEVIATRPTAEDLVVAHGDATFENMLWKHGRFTGFVDCAKLGLADRFQDLALAWRGVRHAFGEEWAAEFLTRYGVRNDDRRLAFYLLLDELF